MVILDNEQHAEPVAGSRRGKIETRHLMLALLCAVSFLAAVGWTLELRRSAAPPPVSAGGPAGSPGAVDVGFSQAMSVHHQQAVYLADVVSRDRGISPEIRALASTINATQLQEIGWMGGWLNLWNEPAIPPRGDPMAWITTNAVYYCGLHRDTMPGLATQAQINALSRASGRRADVLFLQLMLRHHEGGIEMALYGARYGHLAPVRTLARRIVLDQSQEVDLMVRLLRLYGASPLAFPTSQALSSSDVGAVLNESQPQRTQAPLQNAWGK